MTLTKTYSLSIITFTKMQMQVARYVGRKDFDNAIRVLDESLSKNPKEMFSLEMIAWCNRWSHKNDLAIASAQKILAYDPKNFEAFRLLSEIHIERCEHDTAAHFVRLGIANYPEPLPDTPKIFFWILRFGASIFPRFKRIEERAKREIADPNRNHKKWYSWAKQYLAWYDSSSGNVQTPPIH